MSIAEKSIIIAENVPKVYQAGYEKGKADGGGEGDYEQGYNDGYEKGSMPIYCVGQTMGSVWQNAVFSENSEITLRFKKAPSSFYASFYNAVNLKTIKLISEDRSNIYEGTSIFRNIPQLEVVDLTEFNPKPKIISWGFLNDKKLKSILGAFDFSECTGCTAWLSECGALEDISFVPNSIKISIDFSYCSKLTDKSIQSIFDGLSTVETAQTLTLHSNVKILQSQVDSANTKGWTVAGGKVVSEEEYYG